MTRQIQTNFEPRSGKNRLTRSSSAVNHETKTEDERVQTDEHEFQPLGRRPDELSQSQPEEIGDYKKSPPSCQSNGSGSSRHPRANRRRQLLKALSEGTILLDRKRARRFASGYVEVNVQDGPSPAEEEMVAGRVLVHDPTRYLGSGSSDEGSLNDDDLFASSLPVKGRTTATVPSQENNRSLCCSEGDDVGWSSDVDHQLLPLQNDRDQLLEQSHQPLADEPKSNRSLLAQKSFDSNASLPDTAGNYSDEFGSTSQVTILQPNPGPVGGCQSGGGEKNSSYIVASDSDFEPTQHPPTPPPRRIPSTSTAAATCASTPTTDPPETAEFSETEKEIMVQFPPWPGAQDAELIPAPPSFASSHSSIPPVDEDELPLPPPPELSNVHVLASPNKQMSERVLLRHLKHGSKSMSETITSIDSDSSGRRLTEHETSASSEPLSPTSELNSPPQADGSCSNPSKKAGPDSTENSDAFLTALSDHLTTAGLTEVYNTAMERSERSFRESDTSHNSTLRMDRSSVQDLPYEPPPPQELPEVDQGPPSLPPAPLLLTSPDSNNDGQDFGRESSTSGSYSLEATPCASLSPTVPLQSIEMGSAAGLNPLDKPSPRERQPLVCPQEASSAVAASSHPEAVAMDSAPSKTGVSMTTPTDRKTMKEAMKLQFPPGSSMFASAGPSPSVTTPSGATSSSSRSTGRRKHYLPPQQQSANNQLSSTDSDDNDEAATSATASSDRSGRKRRSNKNNAERKDNVQLESGHGTIEKRPADKTKHKKAKSRDASATTPNSHNASDSGVARKRDSQIIGQVVTTPGMVRSPAMHEGFRIADWVAARSPKTSPPPPTESSLMNDQQIFTLQHPSESSFQEIEASSELTGTPWNLMAPSPSQNCDSIRSASPGSDNVFVSETVELSGNGVVKPPEGFADSPATLMADWNLPSAGSLIGGGDGPATVDHNDDDQEHQSVGHQQCSQQQQEPKRKRDSGRGKRTKSCTLPAGSLSASGLSLETAGTRDEAGENQGPHRAVSTIDMWYPETQLPPKRQLTVRAKSEERERWSRPARR